MPTLQRCLRIHRNPHARLTHTCTHQTAAYRIARFMSEPASTHTHTHCHLKSHTNTYNIVYCNLQRTACKDIIAQFVEAHVVGSKATCITLTSVPCLLAMVHMLVEPKRCATMVSDIQAACENAIIQARIAEANFAPPSLPIPALHEHDECPDDPSYQPHILPASNRVPDSGDSSHRTPSLEQSPRLSSPASSSHARDDPAQEVMEGADPDYAPLPISPSTSNNNTPLASSSPLSPSVSPPPPHAPHQRHVPRPVMAAPADSHRPSGLPGQTLPQRHRPQSVHPPRTVAGAAAANMAWVPQPLPHEVPTGRRLLRRMPDHMEPMVTRGARAHYSSRKTAQRGPHTGQIGSLKSLAFTNISTLRREAGWSGPASEETWTRFEGMIYRVLGFLVLMGVTTWQEASLEMYITHVNHFFTYLGFVMVGV